jgi:DNA invertase Pin-like site-specific DNA recombinase
MSVETSHHKVTPEHLRRDAFVYLRQSTPRQVLENVESTKRQYALSDRAAILGWPLERIHTVDNDLGLSGKYADHRDGFQHLVSEVALGHAGIVLGLEVSRLARNNADWQRLLELCALTDTLIGDEDGLYDPAHFNDRLLLGLKGTISEAESHVLESRLQGGLLNKARRGELALSLPIGLVYDATGAVSLDPDQQIQRVIRLAFDTFRQTSSASATVRRFENEGLHFPRRAPGRRGADELQWHPLNHSRLLQLLHNPRYAGAFVYGRTRATRSPTKATSQLKLDREDWRVLIRDAHPGYITWDDFENNQITLQENFAAYGSGRRGALPREGSALLQGHVLCGVCGVRMRTRYQNCGDRLVPYYVCSEESVRRGGKLCQSIRGAEVDAAISQILLQTVAPAAIEVALAVHQEIAGRIEEAEGLRRQELERARYEAELKRRRFHKCDPDHRLVADALEADWNEALRRVELLQRQQDERRQADQYLLDDNACSRIVALANDFPRVWNSTNIDHAERKRVLALLVEDVTLIRKDEVAIHVRFRGGQTASMSVSAPIPSALVKKFKPEVIAQLDTLLDRYTDEEAADQLNALGLRNWKQELFTKEKVIRMRCAYKLKSRFQRLLDQGWVQAVELARRLKVSFTTIHEWGKAGLLARQHCDGNRCVYEPVKSVTFTKGKDGRMIPSFTRVWPATPETV